MATTVGRSARRSEARTRTSGEAGSTPGAGDGGDSGSRARDRTAVVVGRGRPGGLGIVSGSLDQPRVSERGNRSDDTGNPASDDQDMARRAPSEPGGAARPRGNSARRARPLKHSDIRGRPDDA